MKRKILLITISYIIGLIWGLYFNKNIALFICFIGIIYCIKVKKGYVIPLIITTLLSCTWTSNIKNKYDSIYTGIDECSIVGTIVENPMYEGSLKKYVIKVDSVNNIKSFKNTKVIVYEKITSKYNTNTDYGNLIKVYGKFEYPTKSRNYKGFDYNNYLRAKKIYGIIQVNGNNIDICKKNNVSVYKKAINRITKHIKQNIQKTLPDQTANLFVGIILGDKSNLDESIINNFSESNLSHILAVSGMHMSYIVTIISTLLSFFGKKYKKICTILVVFLFCNIVGNTYSVVRASIMIALYILSGLIHRKSDSITNISVAAIAILIYNPYAIMSLSFLLSFVATLGIIMFNKTISCQMPQYLNKNKVTKYIKNSMVLSISANILLIPVTIIFFNKLSFIFIISNIFATFLLSVIMPVGICCIILSFISLNFTKFISYILNILLSVLINIANSTSKFKFLSFIVTTPNIIEIIVYLTCVVLYLVKNKYKKLVKKVIVFLVIISVIFKLLNFVKLNMKIFFIDVGQGDSTLIVTPKRKSILIDGGGTEDSDYVGKNIVVPYLLNRGIKKIDFIIISHFDTDHVRSVY